MFAKRVLLPLVCCLWVFPAFAGSLLTDVFMQVGQNPWGSDKHLLKRAFVDAPVFENDEIMIVPSRIGNQTITLNYLFDKSGRLYNIACYTEMPISEFAAAVEFDKELQDALKAKYGKPAFSESEGDPDAAAEAERQAAAIADFKRRVDEETAAKERKLTAEELKEISGGVAILNLLPGVFYRNLAYWNGGKAWVYTSLACSTDGACYVHLQFASKRLTNRSGGYSPKRAKASETTPLDRDQNLVTKYNREWWFENAAGAQP